MLFYYAHTGHKIGLDRAKRGAAVIKALARKGVEVQLLVNDFRAGVALKEHGIREYVTIETIQDIDAIAQRGDSVIIDSDEEDHGSLVKYVSDFKQVWRFANKREEDSAHGEVLFKAACEDEGCLEAVIVDEVYFEASDKEERVLFFLGDSDHDKRVLDNADFFRHFKMELLLGHYFFVKYEDDLAKLFNTLHEPEEYVELIKSSSTVVTASAQTAVEARVTGAKVIYLDLGRETLYPLELLEKYGITIVKGFDTEGFDAALHSEIPAEKKKIEKIDISKINV
jgi:hypothetical protein